MSTILVVFYFFLFFSRFYDKVKQKKERIAR